MYLSRNWRFVNFKPELKFRTTADEQIFRLEDRLVAWLGKNLLRKTFTPTGLAHTCFLPNNATIGDHWDKEFENFERSFEHVDASLTRSILNILIQIELREPLQCLRTGSEKMP